MREEQDPATDDRTEGRLKAPELQSRQGTMEMAAVRLVRRTEPDLDLYLL